MAGPDATARVTGPAVPAPNSETELKLSVRPEDMAALRSAAVLEGPADGRTVTRTLESVYYDTAELALLGRLATLRVRTAGDRHVQTLKGAPSADGGLTRAEWEWPVAGPEPDLAVITDAEALALLGPVGPEDLKPAFTSQVTRTVRTVERGENTIEVAFDTGEIRSPGGAAIPVSEVELELRQGTPAALFELAEELVKVAPLRVETRTKAARGYALAAGRIDAAQKAEKLTLDRETTVEGALCHIVQSCLDHATANEACALKGDDPEGVHQMRVALRRLRSALALFRPFVPAAQHDWLAGEVKWLAGSLGPARDWDVFLAELLAPVRESVGRTDGRGKPLLDDLAQLESAARARRDRAYDAVRQAILSERRTLFQLRVGAWLEAKGWREQSVTEESARLFQPVVDLADHLLTKRHKKARKTGRGFARLAADERHQVRIALKKLRYAAEFFRALCDEKPARRYLTQLSALQDALGHLNDVATATRLMQELHDDGSKPAPGEARAAGIVIGWHARGVDDSEADLVARWESFAEAKPFWSKPATMA